LTARLRRRVPATAASSDPPRWIATSRQGLGENRFSPPTPARQGPRGGGAKEGFCAGAGAFKGTGRRSPISDRRNSSKIRNVSRSAVTSPARNEALPAASEA